QDDARHAACRAPRQRAQGRRPRRGARRGHPGRQADTDLIPLCHPLRITGVDVTFSQEPRRGILTIETRVRTVDTTGVEMEALTAASVAALTVYDMVKAL